MADQLVHRKARSVVRAVLKHLVFLTDLHLHLQQAERLTSRRLRPLLYRVAQRLIEVHTYLSLYPDCPRKMPFMNQRLYLVQRLLRRCVSTSRRISCFTEVQRIRETRNKRARVLDPLAAWLQ